MLCRVRVRVAVKGQGAGEGGGEACPLRECVCVQALPLKHVDLSRPEIMQLVAERLATFHALDMPLCKKPRWMFSVIRRWVGCSRSARGG